MDERNMTDEDLAHTRSGEETEKKKWPGYCKTIIVRDSHGAVKELVFPKALDLDRPKRERTTFSPEQLGRLEEEFSVNQYLVGKDRTSLASSLGLTETQIKVWFQNRRTKHKKDREKRVESGDNQAESQAAQNVLKLLEYKTAFGYNTVLGGASISKSTHQYEAIDMSNTNPVQLAVHSAPTSNPIDAGHFSPSSRVVAPIDARDEQHLFDAKIGCYSREEPNCSRLVEKRSTLFPHCNSMAKIFGSPLNGEKRSSHAVTSLEQPSHGFSEVLYPEILGLRQFQNFENAAFSSEFTRSNFLRKPIPKNSSERGRYFPPYGTISTIEGRPVLSNSHSMLQNTSKIYGYPEMINCTNYIPVSPARTQQIVHPSFRYPSLTAASGHAGSETAVYSLPPSAGSTTGMKPGESPSLYASVSGQTLSGIHPPITQSNFPVTFS